MDLSVVPVTVHRVIERSPYVLVQRTLYNLVQVIAYRVEMGTTLSGIEQNLESYKTLLKSGIDDCL